MSDQKRTYRMKQRAESQEATRRRIVESAVELHERLGPARTTMAAVAEHAGVRRSTLYRHFPDEAALFVGCSEHWNALHPPPDPARWHRVDDPAERLVGALTELYGWYRGTGTMLDSLLRDESVVPAVRQQFGAFHAYLDAARDILMEGRRLQGRRRSRARAALGLSVRFETWRALCREGGLSDADAAELAAKLVAAA